MFELFYKYPHLLNPFYTLGSDGTSKDDAPNKDNGGISLSDNPRINLGLWNALASSSWLVPTTALLTYIVNRAADKRVKDKIDKTVGVQLQSLRPSISTTEQEGDDIRTISPEFLKLIKTKIRKSASLNKAADVEWRQVAGNIFSKMTAPLKRMGEALTEKLEGSAVTPGAGIALSLGIPLAAVLTAAHLSDKMAKNTIKDELNEESAKMRKAQARVDREMLKLQGLIRSRGIAKEAKVNDIVEKWLSPFTAAVMLATGGLGLIGMHYLRENDPDLNKIKLLEKEIIGGNTLKETPRITLSELPVSLKDVLAVPGDKKQQTVKSKATAQEPKKKDALF